MKVVSASAPGKIILFGEHAVVYGRPAIAVPLTAVHATATVALRTGPLNSASQIEAHDLNRVVHVDDAPDDDPLAAIVRGTFAAYGGRPVLSGLSIVVTSTIPIASGLGSSAAVSAAIARAIAAWLGKPLAPAIISRLVFDTEKLYHGTPSGIDNTVIAYERPVFFVRDRPAEPFDLCRPLRLVVADSGLPASTRSAVSAVRRERTRDPGRYERLFDQMGAIAVQARAALVSGDGDLLGPLMSDNHALLQQIGVSLPVLDGLVDAACAAGAAGAKLSGGGQGGNVIALVTPESEAAVKRALLAAGAERVLGTTVGE